jgi:hypothetical protein
MSPYIIRINRNVVRTQITDNIRQFLQQVVKKLGISYQHVSHVTGKFYNLPVKLKNKKTKRNQYQNRDPDGKTGGNEIFLDEPRRFFGKIHLTGNFLMQGHNQNVEKGGPEENGKERGKKTAYNQKKQEKQYSKQNSLYCLWRIF